MSQQVLAIGQALQVPHQQPDDPEGAINVQPTLVAFCPHPLAGDALYVQQVAAVYTNFCYLQQEMDLLFHDSTWQDWARPGKTV